MEKRLGELGQESDQELMKEDRELQRESRWLAALVECAMLVICSPSLQEHLEKVTPSRHASRGLGLLSP